MFGKKGIKRIFSVCMLAAAPLAYSEPLSIYQEVLPLPSSTRVEMKEPVKITPRKIAKKIKKAQPERAVRGVASWYSETDNFINKHTANGEVFNDQAMTCASWYHPFGTRLKVTNLQNGKSVVCRVNDRGPAKRLKREIDLSIGAFKKISNPRLGLIRVAVTKQS